MCGVGGLGRGTGPPTLFQQPPPGQMCGRLSGRLENLFARVPVARAKLVGLKGVEHAQGLLRVPADIEAVDRHVLDDVVGIDDERRAIGDMLFGIEDPELGRQFLAVVGDPGEIGLRQFIVGTAPRKVDMRRIGRSADQNRIAVSEVLLQFAIADDLGRADESEVLRPVKEDFPLPVGFAEIDRLAGGQR